MANSERRGNLRGLHRYQATQRNPTESPRGNHRQCRASTRRAGHAWIRMRDRVGSSRATWRSSPPCTSPSTSRSRCPPCRTARSRSARNSAPDSCSAAPRANDFPARRSRTPRKPLFRALEPEPGLPIVPADPSQGSRTTTRKRPRPPTGDPGIGRAGSASYTNIRARSMRVPGSGRGATNSGPLPHPTEPLARDAPNRASGSFGVLEPDSSLPLRRGGPER